MFLTVGLFSLSSSARADVIYKPIIPGTSSVVDMIIGGIIIGCIALISWLVIRAIRRKKNVVNK